MVAHILQEHPCISDVQDFIRRGTILLRGSKGMLKSIIFAVVIAFSSSAVCFSAIGSIGFVTEVKGQAFIVRDGRPHAPEVGFELEINDKLNTGQDGAIGVIFDDETLLSLGPNSEMVVNDYLFNPEQSRFSFIVRLVRGTAAYMSGLIAKINPEAVRFITPSGSIGVRGTKMVIRVEEERGTL